MDISYIMTCQTHPRMLRAEQREKLAIPSVREAARAPITLRAILGVTMEMPRVDPDTCKRNPALGVTQIEVTREWSVTAPPSEALDALRAELRNLKQHDPKMHLSHLDYGTPGGPLIPADERRLLEAATLSWAAKTMR